MDRGHLPRRDVLRAGGLLIGALGTATSLSGCGTPAAARAGNVLRVSQPGDPKTLDPQKQGDMVSMNVLINMFDTLTTRGRDNQLHPRLALSWSATDAHTWRFRIRPGVTFHNGEPCEAQAVAFQHQETARPRDEVADRRTPLRQGRQRGRPAHRGPPHHGARPDPARQAVAFRWSGRAAPLSVRGGRRRIRRTSHRHRSLHIRQLAAGPRAAHAGHADHWEGRPSIDGLVFTPAPNASSSLAALQSGGVDLVAGLTRTPLSSSTATPVSPWTASRGSAPPTLLEHSGKGPAPGPPSAPGTQPRRRRPPADQGGARRQGHRDARPRPARRLRLRPLGQAVHPFREHRARVARRRRLPARLLHDAHRVQRRLQRRGGPFGTARPGGRACAGRPPRPRDVRRATHLRQPGGTGSDLSGGQHRLDAGRREHRPVERAPRPAAEPLALEGGGPPHRCRRALPGPRGTQKGLLRPATPHARGSALRLPLPDGQHLRSQRPAPLEAGIRRRPRHGSAEVSR